MGTFKNEVTKIVKGGEALDDAINLFLWDYRMVDHCTTGKSPAWLLYKRKLRMCFNLLRPCLKNTVIKNQSAQIAARRDHILKQNICEKRYCYG